MWSVVALGCPWSPLATRCAASTPEPPYPRRLRHCHAPPSHALPSHALVPSGLSSRTALNTALSHALPTHTLTRPSKPEVAMAVPSGATDIEATLLFGVGVKLSKG